MEDKDNHIEQFVTCEPKGHVCHSLYDPLASRRRVDAYKLTKEAVSTVYIYTAVHFKPAS